jgi:hypothetical protein
MEGTITMGSKELSNYRHAMNVLEGRLSIVEFSLLTQKSYRQCQRIIQKIKLGGMLGAVHAHKGKVPVNKTPDALKYEILSLLRGPYYDFNLSHFLEMLQEKEGIKITYSTLYRWARKDGLIKHQKRRSSKKHSTRARLPREGMLIQFDGSEHRWFSNIICDLIAGIDDATGKIVAALFCFGESSINSMKVIREIVINHGIPEAFYMDEAAIFGKRDRDWNSQIARALETLNCKLILASSPQAKGRVERLFRTLQDRLIAELGFCEIKTIEDANDYLKNIFIPKFNQQFTVLPREKEQSYQTFIPLNLETILCRKVVRKVTSGNAFSYLGESYLIKGERDYRFRRVNINTHLDEQQSFDILGKKILVEKISPQLKQEAS